mgnify:FL=1
MFAIGAVMFHTVPYDETRLWAGNDQQQQRPQSVAAAGTASEPRLLNQRTSSIPAAAAAAATAAADEPPTPRTVQRHLFNEWGHAASPRPATVASRSIKSTIIKPAPPTASSMTSVASTSAAAAADTGSPSSTSRTASLLAARNRSGAAARAQSATAVFQSHAGAKHDTGVHDFFTSDSGRWLRKVVAGAIALTVLVVYLSTMYQHVPGGDAGELIIGAHQWAVVHPPGYPLFTTIGFVFDAALSRLALPNGSFCHSTACHVGLVSVVFDTAAAVLIFWLVTCVYFPELQFDIGAAAASSPSDPRRVSAELVSGISRLIGGAIAALLFAFRYSHVTRSLLLLLLLSLTCCAPARSCGPTPRRPRSFRSTTSLWRCCSSYCTCMRAITRTTARSSVSHRPSCTTPSWAASSAACRSRTNSTLRS